MILLDLTGRTLQTVVTQMQIAISNISFVVAITIIHVSILVVIVIIIIIHII